ncbi:MAG: PAS domain-containing protein [Pseudomonadota bacterium]
MAMLFRVFISRITLSVALVMTLACAIVGIAMTSAGHFDVRGAHIERLENNTIVSIRAAIDERKYPTFEQLVDLSDHLIRVSPIEGLTFVNSVGDPEVFSGERTTLTWRDVRLDQIERQFVKDNASLEFFIDPDEVELPFGVVVRVAVDDMWRSINEDTRRTAAVIAAFSVSTTILTTVMIAISLVMPLRHLHTSTMAARHSPHEAINHVVKFKRDDEIGDLGRAIDRIFYLLTSTFEEDLSNAIALQEEMPMGLIVFSASDRVLAANDAALSFFGFSSPSDIESYETEIIRKSDGIASVRKIVDAETFSGVAELKRGDDWVRCVVGAHAIRDIEGNVRRYFLIFNTLQQIEEEISDLRMERDTLQVDVTRHQQREAELKTLLDACLTIIDTDGSRKSVPDSTRTFPDQIVARWYRVSIDQNLMTERSLRHGVLPALKVDATVADSLFSHALSLVRMRSKSDATRIQITSRPQTTTQLLLIISERTIDPPEDNEIAPVPEAHILLAALTKLIRSAGGQIVATSGKKSSNRVAFTLPIADDVEEVLPEYPEELEALNNVA